MTPLRKHLRVSTVASGCSSLFFHNEARVVPFVNIDSSLELSVLDDRQSSSTHWVHVVFPFPGKFQTFLLVGRCKTISNIPMDGSKLKDSRMILTKGDMSWHHEVDEVLIPLCHLANPPCSHILIAHRVLFRFVSTLHAPLASPLCGGMSQTPLPIVCAAGGLPDTAWLLPLRLSPGAGGLPHERETLQQASP